jgi:hypothetical protein
VFGSALIVGVAIRGTVLQNRSLADYDRTRGALQAEIARYEGVLVNGESRSQAVAALTGAGAQIDSTHGDIVVTILRELGASSRCHSLVGVLHVEIDAHERVDGWESPALGAECEQSRTKDSQ